MSGVKPEHQHGILTVENSSIRRQFSTRNAFVPISFFNKLKPCELLTKSQPWFECVINGTQLTSGEYLAYDSRTMKHGGLEVIISIGVKDFIFAYRLQMFPGSPITRERLIIVPSEHSFSLNNLTGKQHFIFLKPNHFGGTKWGAGQNYTLLSKIKKNTNGQF